nr:hypothetical protein [Gloeobacter morelensis]
MGFHIPREARDIVDQDDMLGAAIGFEVFEHREHSGAVDDPAGNGFIAEDFRDLIALHPGELPAARFLRAEAVAFLHLRDAGDARINDGGGGGGFWFGGLSSHGVSPPCMC